MGALQWPFPRLAPRPRPAWHPRLPRPTRRPVRPGRPRRPRRGVRLGPLATPLDHLHELLRGRPRVRTTLLGGIAAAVVVVGFWLWFRDSSFASVQRVHIAGVSGPQAAAIEATLRRQARHMSTLDYSDAALEASVEAYPQVRSIQAAASFPHTMRIVVREQLPAAVLVAPSGSRTAAAGDGAVLGGALATASLPTVSVPAMPRGAEREAQTLAYLSVLGAAPAPLSALIARAYTSDKGLTVALRDGLLIYFGDASTPHAKWVAFARALLANGTGEAVYVDVRAPERPAVGTTEPAGSTAAAGTPSTVSGTAVASGGGEAALIAGLEATVGAEGVNFSAPASAAAASEAQGGASAQASGEGSSEGRAEAEQEASPGGSGEAEQPAGGAPEGAAGSASEGTAGEAAG